MAWRTIQDSTPHSKTLSRLSDRAERVFWRMLSASDSWGRLEGAPWRVKSRCLPLVAMTEEEVGEAIEELVAGGRIVLYSGHDGRLVCQLAEFDDHQTPKQILDRGESRYEAPPAAALEHASARLAEIRGVRYRTVPNGAAPTEQRQEREIEKGSPTAVASYEGLPFSIETLVSDLRDADEATATIIEKLATGLPEAAIARAREALHEKRRHGGVRSDSGYVVAALKRMREEGQYASGASAA